MLTRRKLLSLPPATRRRKIVRLLRTWEYSHLQAPGSTPLSLIKNLLSVLSEDPVSTEISTSLKTVLEAEDKYAETFCWKLKRLRTLLEDELGIDFADWDITLPESGELDPAARTVLSHALYIDGVRSPFNLGSIFRSAECFGIREILISPGSTLPTHPRAVRSSMGCTRSLPWRTADYDELIGSKNLFALELGGTALGDFSFPLEGICVIGSEELGVHPDIRKEAKKRKGIVSIPLLGSKASLNVSVAAGILMQEWARACALISRPVRSPAD